MASRTRVHGAKGQGERAAPRQPAHARRSPRPRIEPRIKERKVSVARAAGRRRLYVVIALVALIILIVGAFQLARSSLFSARHIVIVGVTHTARSEVLAASGLLSHPPLLDVNTGSVQHSLDQLPWVRSAAVSRHWPSTVRISIVERVPIGEVAIGVHRYALIDNTGRVLGDVSSPMAGVVNVADVGEVPAPGRYLSKSAQPIVETAAATPISLLSQINYVGSTKQNGVVVALHAGPIAVFATVSDLRQKMVSLATVLAPSSKISMVGIVTIDLRVPSSPVLTR